MNFPEKKKDNIIVDRKCVGIWDFVNLAKLGGIINLENNYAIEIIKQDQKWCQLYLVRYALNGVKQTQSFTPVKTVKDDVLVKELREKLKILTKNFSDLSRENVNLKKNLADYNTTGHSSVSDKVIEL